MIMKFQSRTKTRLFLKILTISDKTFDWFLVLLVVAFIYSRLLNRHKKSTSRVPTGEEEGGSNVMWRKTREGGSIKHFAVWRKSTDINRQDCQGLIQGAGLTLENKEDTVIAEIFVRVKISYSSVREFSYAINFRTLKAVSHTLVYAQGFRMLLIFVLSAKSTKYTKLNRVLKFLRLQYFR